MAKKGLIKLSLLILILVVIFLPPFAKYQELRSKNKRLGDQIKSLKKEAKRLEEEKRRLKSDITYVEKKAREKIGVVRKGEIVIKEVPEETKKK